ncbi:hypothetical protein PBV87_03005 [Niameybacter massiliensis]|uniref:Uncharacterized protein n=1 Tax=Holtiella tumoricola TaxID=3018743 RepID=A0AA42IZM7_9FIRM|nr:hypothetical protein [Holtiella tumoricola]MDA3730475.1 hypothetical protein [Holtiella tumoricola]
MFEQIKSELSGGKKIYIFEVISMIGFVLLLTVGSQIPILATTMVGNIIMYAWIFINLLVIVIYNVHEFVNIIMKQKVVEGNIIRCLLIKFLFFVSLFMINIFPITMLMLLAGGRMGIDMSLPIFALMVALFIVCLAKKGIPSTKALTFLGVLWFVTIFSALYFVYPLLFVGITSLVKQEMISSTILSIIFFGGALLIFYQIMNRVKAFIEAK